MSLDIMTIPVITVEQMIKIEQLMINKFDVPMSVLMKTAGQKLAEFSRQMLNGNLAGKHVALVVGNRKYRECGIATAALLTCFGSRVTLLDSNFDDSVLLENQHVIFEDPNFTYRSGANPFFGDSYDLILDLLLGYDIWKQCPGEYLEMMQEMNYSGTPVISLDIPSRLNGTSGISSDHCIRATATLALALPKVGLLLPDAVPYVGDLFLADITIPASLYKYLGISFNPIFKNNDILSLGENSLVENSQLFEDHDFFNQGCLLLEKE